MNKAQSAENTLVRSLPELAEEAAMIAICQSHFTRLLTSHVESILAECGAKVELEFPVGKYRTARDSRESRGYIDVFAAYRDTSALAVEIDRSNKKRSVEKLRHAAQTHGARTLWIRWRGIIRIPDGAVVGILDLTHIGQRVPRGAASLDAFRDLRKGE